MVLFLTSACFCYFFFLIFKCICLTSFVMITGKICNSDSHSLFLGGEVWASGTWPLSLMTNCMNNVKNNWYYTLAQLAFSCFAVKHACDRTWFLQKMHSFLRIWTKSNVSVSVIRKQKLGNFEIKKINKDMASNSHLNYFWLLYLHFVIVCCCWTSSKKGLFCPTHETNVLIVLTMTYIAGSGFFVYKMNGNVFC